MTEPGHPKSADETAPDAGRPAEGTPSVPSSPAGPAPVLWVLCGFLVLAAAYWFLWDANFRGATQRGQQKRTMGDMRAISTAVESYAIDNGAHPRGGPTVDSIREFLEPTYARELPTRDAWNGPYLYESDRDRATYRIESRGKDGRDSGPDVGPTTDPRDDIVLDTGRFVAWPDPAR